ncbi:MAG: hypothetical protein HC773_31085 [Scytonema sp. CRU_2_7]|nr:hypothetical protein [Scytonema sp. CRU_2_7]
MAEKITAVFDGKVFYPTESIALPANNSCTAEYRSFTAGETGECIISNDRAIAQILGSG